MALVTVKNLSFHYDDKPALKDVSFSLREGEFAVLTGPSGSGKSLGQEGHCGAIRGRNADACARFGHGGGAQAAFVG